MPLAISDPEKEFSIALTEQKIAVLEEEEVKKFLRRVMVKIGLRAANYPKDEEKTLLINHVYTSFGNHTGREILLAFDMALAGQLPVEANCYENFSCLYFSGIMNAYREWAAEAYKHVVKDAPKALPKPREDISDAGMEKWLEELKVSKLPVNFLPLQMYDWLVEKERIVKTGKEKKAYVDMAVSYQQGKLIKACDELMNPENRQALSEFNQMKAKGEFTGLVAEQLINLAKKMILYDYLNAK